MLVPAAGGPGQLLTKEKWTQVYGAAWLADGRGLVLSLVDRTSLNSQIYYFPYPNGELRRITNDLNSYRGLSATADSSALVTIQSDQIANLWIVAVDNPLQAQQITSGLARHDGTGGIAWTPDGRIVHTSDATGGRELWITGADGSGSQQLTSDSRITGSPRVSADGRSIAFASDRLTGNAHVWRMDIAGGNLKQLTSGVRDSLPDFSPDGKWIIYNQISADFPTLCKVPIDGGDSIRLTGSDAFIFFPTYSPDGTKIAANYVQGPKRCVAILSAENAKPVQFLDIGMPRVLRWSPDGSSLYFIKTEGAVSNIWQQPIAGGAPKQVTDFKTDSIFSFDVSRDGKRFVLSRGTSNVDVMMIRDVK